jgi:hypothetical protein
MAGPSRQICALILNRAEQGERYLRYHLITPEDGAVNALWRRSSKLNAPTPPDLFSRIEATIQPSARSKAFFLNEYRALKAHLGIARNYQCFLEASQFSQTIWRNLRHAEFFEPLYQLSGDAFAAFEKGIRPELVHFKALYRLARNEGYPVKEDWWTHLDPNAREAVVQLLQRPVEDPPVDEQRTRGYLRSLQHYLRYSTEIIIPDMTDKAW